MKNTIENIIIALVVFIAGSSIGGFVAYKAMSGIVEKMMIHQNAITIEAINKNTTEVINQHLTEIKKLKLRDSEISNVNSDRVEPVIIQKQPLKSEKKTFWFFKRK